MNLFLKKLSVKTRSVLSWFSRLSLIKKGVIVFIVLAIIFGGYKLTVGKNNIETQLQTVTVEKGTLITSVTSSGTISSANNISIETQSTGVVSEVYVKNGDYISAGQAIGTITLDKSSQQKYAAAYASYLSAQNSLNSANAKINSLQSSLFKANQTFVNGKGSSLTPDTSDPTYIMQRADWLQAEADYNNQTGVIAAAQASLNNASLELSQTSNIITAPISGIVTNLNLAVGFPLSNTQSADTSSNSTNSNIVGNITLEGAALQATVNLTEIDVTQVKVGQKVTMTLDAFSDKTFTGKISSINTNGSVSSGVTTYPATITFDTSLENIYPNMAVSATIITSVKSDVLLVPSSAVKTLNGNSYVTIQKNGKEEQVLVEVGESNDTQTEITSGLSEGGTVVVSTTSLSPVGGNNSQNSVFGGAGFGGAARSGGAGGQIRIQQIR